jgi:hypothetical protein
MASSGKNDLRTLLVSSIKIVKRHMHSAPPCPHRDHTIHVPVSDANRAARALSIEDNSLWHQCACFKEHQRL